MIIKGNFIYTPSLDKIEIREHQYLYVKDGIVDSFYEKVPYELAEEELIDYGESIIIPAFNDLHIHAPQYINRGVGLDKELLPWLDTYTFPVEAKYSDLDFAERSYKLFLNRMWAVGTMRFSAFATLHNESTWKLMQLTEVSGLKAFIGKVNMDRNAPEYLVEETSKSLSETEELINRCSEELSNVEYIITPRFVPSTTERMMKGLGKLCEKYDLPVQSHLSENRNEISWVKSLHPNIKSYTEVYDAYGLLKKNNTIMAHSIYLSNEEKEILDIKNVFMAHCAQSNANLTSGIMPLRKNLNKGLNCIIASDIAGSHTPAMNRHIVISIETSKLNEISKPEEKALSLSEALYLSTKKPGKFFGKVGSFEKDYDFDALVIEMNEMEKMFLRTPFEKLEQYLYDGDDRNILARYCRGKLIKRPFSEY